LLARVCRAPGSMRRAASARVLRWCYGVSCSPQNGKASRRHRDWRCGVVTTPCPAYARWRSGAVECEVVGGTPVSACAASRTTQRYGGRCAYRACQRRVVPPCPRMRKVKRVTGRRQCARHAQRPGVHVLLSSERYSHATALEASQTSNGQVCRHAPVARGPSRGAS